MRTILRWILTPALVLILHVHRAGDDWEELPVAVPFWRFGAGSRKRFSWYFEGESDVSVSSVDDVVAWLSGCRYVPDKTLFQEDDFWQHPRTFERLRAGDCEDFALWGWRKLNELGVPARFFVGKLVDNGRGSASGHAWVVFRQDGKDMLLEGASTAPESLVQPLDAVRDRYRPHFSVDGSYRTRAFSGYLTTLKEDRERRKRFGRADVVGS